MTVCLSDVDRPSSDEFDSYGNISIAGKTMAIKQRAKAAVTERSVKLATSSQLLVAGYLF